MTTQLIGTGAAGINPSASEASVANEYNGDYRWLRERGGSNEVLCDTTSSLAIRAGRSAIEAAGLAPSDVHVLILATSTPDQVMPGSAAITQQELGTSGGGFDLNSSSSAFISALVCGFGLMNSGGRPVLVIGSDVIASQRFVQGSGAGAIVLQKSVAPSLQGYDLGSSPSTIALEDQHFDGEAIDPTSAAFSDSVDSMIRSTKASLDRANTTLTDIDVVISHKGDERILIEACNRLGLPLDRIADLDGEKNQSTGSLPMALDKALRGQRIQPGNRVLLCGSGVDMTWSTAILSWA